MTSSNQSGVGVAAPAAAPALAEGAEQYVQCIERWGNESPIASSHEIEYGPHANQKLDVYFPPGRRCLLPILVFFHGGAWIGGSRSWLRFMAPAVTSLPAIFVAGTYRLAPTFRWPDQYEDVCDAIAAVQARAASFEGDASRIVVGGHSAGGHLASLAVLKREIAPVRACFPISSSFNLQYGEVASDSAENRVHKYLLKRRQQDFGASPINFISGNRTQFHLAWGAKDFERISRSGAEMAQALARDSAPVSFHVAPDAGHFDMHMRLRDPAREWYSTLRTALAGET